MSEISNEQIYGALLDIKQDLGALSAKADTTAQWLSQHETRVSALEAGANRQKGAAKVLALLATALGAVGGMAVTWLSGGRH